MAAARVEAREAAETVAADREVAMEVEAMEAEGTAVETAVGEVAAVKGPRMATT